jgi:predicted CxxxxCH...CXXCH cytochrome family protein
MDNPSRLGIWAGLSLMLACSDVRPLVNEPSCPGWLDGVGLNDQSEIVRGTQGIGELFKSQCASCHSGSKPAGGFDVSSYETVLSRLKAGDRNSVLLKTLNPATASTAHANLAQSVYAPVATWVVTCNAAYATGGVHTAGIQNPAQSDFHSNLAEKSMDACRSCHGQKLDADLGQGIRPVRACVSCHPGFSDSPGTDSSCSACHGNPPSTGAHTKHMSGTMAVLTCADCHPRRTDSSHAKDANGVRRTSAEITFATSSLAARGTSNRSGAPTWDSGSKTCRNVYCHGATLGDKASVTTSPKWTDSRPAAQACTFCHGLPPNNGEHPATQNKATDCQKCHRFTSDSAGAIVVGGKHMNGVTDVP